MSAGAEATFSMRNRIHGVSSAGYREAVRKIHERLGDDIVNELVDWFNAVDSTYQAQLKELNDLNWGRIEARFAAVDVRFDAFEAKIAARFSEFEAKVDEKLARQKNEMILWMFGFWSATVIPIVALMIAFQGGFRR